MNADDVLLLFDTQYPCWTAAMLEMSDVSLDTVAFLLAQGMLSRAGNNYFLSDVGRVRFEILARESWLFLSPGVLANNGNNNEEIEHTAFACELKFLLDKGHMQRWGLKEYELPFTVTIPALSPEEIFRLGARRVEWLWPQHPVFKEMRAITTPSDINIWLAKNIPVQLQREVRFDLLYKSRYDFQMYTQFKPLQTDKYGLFNVDRFLFSHPPVSQREERTFYLTRIGEFQMFFDMVRHLYLPGFTDRDALEQDCANWLLFAFASEAEAEACANLLAPFHDTFSSSETGSTPTEIWSVSLEGLKNYCDSTTETPETIWDLLPFAAHSIYRLE